MRFLTGGSERMRVFSSGNVYIGASPVDTGVKLYLESSTSDLIRMKRGIADYSFQLAGTSLYLLNIATTTYALAVSNNGNVGIGGTVNPEKRLDVVSSTNDNFDAIVVRPNNQTQTLNIGWQGISASLNFIVNTGGSERMRIFQGGNVFIGTSPTDAGYKLDVNGTGRFSGNNNVLTINSNWTTTNQIGTTFNAPTNANSGSSNGTNVAIHGTPYGTALRFLMGASIYASQACVFVYGSTTVGSIGTNSTSTSYNTSSDYRLKENVVPMESSINRLKELNPCRFNFINNPDKTVDGFIAHEVQEIVPEAITGEKDELDYDGSPKYQGIDQSKIVPLLTSALQEAISKIEELENRLLILENK